MVVVEEKKIGTAKIREGGVPGVSPGPGAPGVTPSKLPSGLLSNLEKVKNALDNHSGKLECPTPEMLEKESGISSVRDYLAILRVAEYSVKTGDNRECGAGLAKELGKRLKRCGY